MTFCRQKKKRYKTKTRVFPSNIVVEVRSCGGLLTLKERKKGQMQNIVKIKQKFEVFLFWPR